MPPIDFYFIFFTSEAKRIITSEITPFACVDLLLPGFAEFISHTVNKESINNELFTIV